MVNTKKGLDIHVNKIRMLKILEEFGVDTESAKKWLAKH